MFRIVSALALALALCLTGLALAEEAAQAPENEPSAEVLALLEAATADPDGPLYEPETLLGEVEEALLRPVPRPVR